MKFAFLTLLAFSSLSALAQPYKSEKIVFTDDYGNKAKEKEAARMEQHIKIDDTLFEANLYKTDGPRIRSVQYSDAAEQDRNGWYVSYNTAGMTDTLGAYTHGRKDGTWLIYSGKLLKYRLRYADGKLLWKKDTVEYKRYSDSLDIARNDTAAKLEVQSQFPGGDHGWLQFLNINLRYPKEAVKKNQQGQTVIGFVVGKDGKLDKESIWVDRSSTYYLDKEALRIIYITPEWTPATVNGKPLRSYKKQPVIYRLE